MFNTAFPLLIVLNLNFIIHYNYIKIDQKFYLPGREILSRGKCDINFY